MAKPCFEFLGGIPVQEAFSLSWERVLPGPVISVATTPTFSMLVAGCVDRRIYTFDHKRSDGWSKALDHEVWSVACTRDGDCVAAGTADKKPSRGTVHILSQNGNELLTHRTDAPIWSLSFSEDGLWLAAGSWLSNCIVFRRESGIWRHWRTYSVPGAGTYGSILLDNEGSIAAVGYGAGIVQLSPSQPGDRVINDELVGYNICHAPTSRRLYAGARNGQVIRIDSDASIQRVTVPNASRAVCGVATVHDGALLFTGSFDGHFRALSPSGELFWEKDCTGEVWSVSCSPNGGKIALGCGDGRVIVLSSSLTSDTLAELDAYKRSLAARQSGDTGSRFRRALSFLSSVGLFHYALRLFNELLTLNRLEPILYESLIDELYTLVPSSHQHLPAIAFEVANLARQKADHWKSATYYLKSSRDPSLRLRALTEAANEFLAADHPAAAIACFRRAREPVLTNDDLRIIYVLARSFEDIGQEKIARDHLDTIMVQNPDYRDVAQRLQRLRRNIGTDVPKIDYTGLTVNLLGPDAPSLDVDPRLTNVVRARSAELNVTSMERNEYISVINDLYDKKILAEQATAAEVEYDRDAYVKYDHLLPEDDVKKKLEAINLVALTRRVPSARTSLDIGTATGRYPALFTNLGYTACGIDKAPNAIDYCRSKFTGQSHPEFSEGDVREIQFAENTFDIVTCMMGTFFHIPGEDHARSLMEMLRVCKPRGMVAISTWDLECPHLTFLSMYSVKEKELIARNARSVTEMLRMFHESGFERSAIVRFGLVPDTISYDLGIDNLGIDGVKRLLEIDIAARTAVPSKHGQMFIVYGFKAD